MTSKNRRVIFTSLIFSLFTFWFGHRLGTGEIEFRPASRFLGESVKKQRQSSRPELDQFWEVWDLLHTHYLRRDELNNRELLYGAASGLTEATGDPYTAFLTPEENENVRAGISGEYEGIGAELGMEDGRLVIVSPLDESPAERAGV